MNKKEKEEFLKKIITDKINDLEKAIRENTEQKYKLENELLQKYDEKLQKIMDKNEYGEIINGENTYKEIADRLIKGQAVIIGWTDQGRTHLDILFTYKVYKEIGSYLQRGLRGNELFVSIMSLGAFGFDINDSKKAPGYIGEKLGLNNCPTTEKLAELINAVIKEIHNETI